MSRVNHALRRGIRKPHKLKVSFYEVHMTELEKYLAIFPSSKASKNRRNIFKQNYIVYYTEWSGGWFLGCYL